MPAKWQLDIKTWEQSIIENGSCNLQLCVDSFTNRKAYI